METREQLYTLIKGVLYDNKDVVYSPQEMRDVMALSRQQGVSGIAFEGFLKGKDAWPRDRVNEYEMLKLEWLGDTSEVVNAYQVLTTVENYISDKLKAEGIKALVLKGSAYAKYYDTPEFRQYGDIDIYSPTEFERMDAILKEIGEGYDLECYRHSHCVVKGITIENHIYLTDARWKKKWMPLEQFLAKEAEEYISSVDNVGLFTPDDTFAVIFYLYHTLAHLAYEHINVRFLLDWYYLLTHSENLNELVLAEKMQEFGLVRIAGIVTALCIKRLELKDEVIPECLLEAAKQVKPELLDKVETDMFDTTHEGFSTNSLRDRIKRIFTFYHYKWKITDVLGMSFVGFIWSKVAAILKWNQ